MTIEQIAQVAHEANRIYCFLMGDCSIPVWESSAESQKNSVINGVKFHLANPDADPEASHENWLKEKIDNGWSHGPIKNPDTKQHPCCVPYDALPAEHKVKDALFTGIVNAMKVLIPSEAARVAKEASEAEQDAAGDAEAAGEGSEGIEATPDPPQEDSEPTEPGETAGVDDDPDKAEVDPAEVL